MKIKKKPPYFEGIGTLTVIRFYWLKTKKKIKILFRSILFDPRRYGLYTQTILYKTREPYLYRTSSTLQPTGSQVTTTTCLRLYDDDFYFSVHFQRRVYNNNIIIHNKITYIHRQRAMWKVTFLLIMLY